MESQSPESSRKKRIYNPYQEVEAPYRAIYELPTSPEFLFAEESSKQRRSWGENLTFYTGCAYLAGSLSGGSVGLLQGLRSSEPGDTPKLRLNRLLNASGHSGRLWGNRVGVVGLVYAGMESGLVSLSDRDDLSTTVLAGLATGALCRAARGIRSAALAGAVGGVLAASAHMINRYAPI